MKKIVVILFLFSMSVSLNAIAGSEDILGEWITAEGKSKVIIDKCGAKYCGHITWLKEPKFPADDDQAMAGMVKHDRNNPEKGLQKRPLLDLTILTNFQFAGGNKWEDGEIYDPKNGKTYSCILTLENSKTLKVRGYIGFSFIGRTTTWTRN